MEVMNHGVCNLGVYERSPYPCFLEALSVGRYSFGGYDLGVFDGSPKCHVYSNGKSVTRFELE